MEKATRYSKKREAILEAIRSTDAHPSADWVYQSLKQEYPDLSLGTVYRNLARFKEEGVIASVGTVNGQERFDGMVNHHAHFVCNNCASVMDFHGLDQDESMDRLVEEKFGMKIDHHELVFYGICPHCNRTQ